MLTTFEGLKFNIIDDRDTSKSNRRCCEFWGCWTETLL